MVYFLHRHDRERYIYLLGSKCGDFEVISGGSDSVGLTCILFVEKRKKVQSGCPSAYMLSIPYW